MNGKKIILEILHYILLMLILSGTWIVAMDIFKGDLILTWFATLGIFIILDTLLHWMFKI